MKAILRCRFSKYAIKSHYGNSVRLWRREIKSAICKDCKKKIIGSFSYIVKNMAYMEYCAEYTVGESKDFYFLLPQSLTPSEHTRIISRTAVENAPGARE